MFEFKEVNQELEYEVSIRKKLSTIIRGIERINMSSYERNGRRYYRSYKNGHYEYIGCETDKEVVKQKKRYLLEQILDRLDCNIALMENLKEQFREYNPYLIQKEFRPGFQNIPSEIIEQLGFGEPGSNVSSSNSKYSDDLKYVTVSGVLVRSRIEAIIADIYTSKGIPFYYEKELILPDGAAIYPDFAARNRRTGKMIYHEHIGMLSNNEYLKGFIWKIQKYIKSQYYPFDSVIFTFEKADGSVNTAEIAEIIDIYF